MGNKDRNKKSGKEAIIKVQVRDNANSYYAVIGNEMQLNYSYILKLELTESANG